MAQHSSGGYYFDALRKSYCIMIKSVVRQSRKCICKIEYSFKCLSTFDHPYKDEKNRNVLGRVVKICCRGW